MPDNVWHTLERVGTPMKSFAANFSLEQFLWTLPDIREEATKEEEVMAPQIPSPKIPVKIDDSVMLIPIIPMGRPIPSPKDFEVPPTVKRLSMHEVNPDVTLVNSSR